MFPAQDCTYTYWTLAFLFANSVRQFGKTLYSTRDQRHFRHTPDHIGSSMYGDSQPAAPKHILPTGSVRFYEQLTRLNTHHQKPLAAKNELR
jgi:hypothetical protein